VRIENKLDAISGQLERLAHIAAGINFE